MKSKVAFLGVLFFVLGFVACAGKTPYYLPFGKIPAANSQEIHIAKAYDFVFLNTFDAIGTLPNWVPDKTRKDEGLIHVRNTQYSRLDDSDLRMISIRIRRNDAQQTSVFLEPESRRVIGADEVLDAIRKKFNVA